MNKKDTKSSFYDICAMYAYSKAYQRDIESLPVQSGVPVAIVVRMVCNVPVSEGDARSVLEALSQQTGQSYTLENVAVKLIKEK